MILTEETTYYELLEVAPNASPAEIRAAYMRVKSAYKKGSVALYTLISEEETEEVLQRIEHAYTVLSDPNKRREYDQNHGILSPKIGTGAPSGPGAKVISIDRVPPMERDHGEAMILVPPSTDFDAPPEDTPLTPPTSSASAKASDSRPQEPQPLAPDSPARPASQRIADVLAMEIAQEAEWSGAFLKKVREARAVSLEELSEYTKVSKTYLTAIEEEIFDRLPAPVFLRGFVTQVAKYLRLPHAKVAAAYMARYNRATEKKQ